MTANIKFIAIISIGALVIIGGVYFYKQKQPGGNLTSVKPSNTQQQSTPKVPVASIPPKLPTFSATSSAQEINKYISEVEALAKTVSEVKFTSCAADPMVSKIQIKSDMSIRNNDSKDIKISVTPKTSFEVPANESINTKINLEPGVYRYNCTYTSGSGGNSDAGILYVVK